MGAVLEVDEGRIISFVELLSLFTAPIQVYNLTRFISTQRSTSRDAKRPFLILLDDTLTLLR